MKNKEKNKILEKMEFWSIKFKNKVQYKGRNGNLENKKNWDTEKKNSIYLKKKRGRHRY